MTAMSRSALAYLVDKHACNKLFQRIPVRYIRGFGTSKIYIKILFQEAQ